MKIQIKSRFDSSKVLFECEAENIKQALQQAVLQGAYLQDADLRGADLRGADLQDANLQDADLRGANLRGANLRDADLQGATLPDHSILPEGDIIGWKKLGDKTICKLLIPASAKRVGGLVGRKCRAEYAVVLEGEGLSNHDEKTYYKVGSTIHPDSYDPNPAVECSHGIHFFITRKEAEAY